MIKNNYWKQFKPWQHVPTITRTDYVTAHENFLGKFRKTGKSHATFTKSKTYSQGRLWKGRLLNLRQFISADKNPLSFYLWKWMAILEKEGGQFPHSERPAHVVKFKWTTLKRKKVRGMRQKIKKTFPGTQTIKKSKSCSLYSALWISSAISGESISTQ